jgi:hypothetical protein
MADEFDDISEFLEKRFEGADEPEDLRDPMRPDQQIQRVKEQRRKENPGVDLVIKRAVRDRNKL